MLPSIVYRLVLDSIHATSPEIMGHLEELGLSFVAVYADSAQPEDRLLRRIVRDYESRGGRAPEETIRMWDLTTWPGEVEFVRPTILNLDPVEDLFLVTQFPDDLGLSREELEERSRLLADLGVPPTYEAYAARA